MAYIANDILQDVSLVLVDQYSNTTLTAPILATGVKVATPASMNAIYVGAQLLVGFGTANAEVVTVTAATLTTFTATFAHTHANAETVVGATFPAGVAQQNPLFTQVEMLGYLAAVQNDFLVKVQQLVYAIATQTVNTGQSVYAAPSDAMRIERISITGAQLFDVSQTALDFDEPNWQSQSAQAPTSFFQDKISTPTVIQYGLTPTPSVGSTAKVWYSQRGPQALALNSSLLVPDPITIYYKYGILARCFDKDGPTNDPMRSKYCKQRYTLGTQIVSRFIFSVQPGMGKAVQQ